MHAATLSLAPASGSVAAGTAFSIDLLIDALDAPGDHPGLIGGEILVTFDPTLLTWGGFAPAGAVSLYSAPVIGSAGSLQTVSFGFDNAPDSGIAGTLGFTAIGAAGSNATLTLADADDFFGTFASYTPTYQPFAPAFEGASVAIVPIPAALWLMCPALAALSLVSRRRPRA